MRTTHFYGDGLSGKSFSVSGFAGVPCWPTQIDMTTGQWPRKGFLVGPPKVLQLFYAFPLSDYAFNGFSFSGWAKFLTNTFFNPIARTRAVFGEIQARVAAVDPSIFVAQSFGVKQGQSAWNSSSAFKACASPATFVVQPGTQYLHHVPVPNVTPYNSPAALAPGAPKLGADFISIYAGIPMDDPFLEGRYNTIPSWTINGPQPSDFAAIPQTSAAVAAQMYWIPRYTAAWWGTGNEPYAGQAGVVPWSPGTGFPQAVWEADAASIASVWNLISNSQATNDSFLKATSDALDGASDRISSTYNGPCVSMTADAIAAVIKDTWGSTSKGRNLGYISCSYYGRFIMAVAVPPVVTAPPDTIPIQPLVPNVTFTGIGSFSPTQQAENTADVVFRAEADIAIEQFRSSTETAVAGATIQERYYRDGVDYYTSLYGANQASYAQRYSADRQLEAEVLRLNTVPAGELALQTNELATRVQVATINANANIYGADRDYSASVHQTDQRYAADVLSANNSLAANKYSADQELAGKTFVASTNKDAAVIQSTNDLASRQYEADQRLIGDKYQADQQYAGTVLHENAETARLTTKLNYADSKFNIVYPVVQASLAASTSTTTPGLKQWPDLPFIATSGVLTPAQVQQQVNAAWAKNDSRTQAQILQTQKELSGRGFSSNSPLLEALKVGYIGQNLRANNDAATQIRIQAAQANADAVFNGQKAVADQFNNQQSVVLESEKNQVTRQVGLVGALAQLIGGIT